MERYKALDVFRGGAVALMILVNNPGTWDYIYAPLKHAPWNGFTPADLVFPFFLFAVGCAQSLVFPRMWEKHSETYFFKKVIRRSIVIFFLGLILNWFPFVHWFKSELGFKAWTWIDEVGQMKGIRIMGVLQRIALAYGFSSFLEYFFPKKILTLSLLILILYWGICISFGVGDVHSLSGWFGTSFDKFILGEVHLYQGEGRPFDPEGLASTLPAISQVMLGFWSGRILQAYTLRKSIRSLFKRGSIFILLGIGWSLSHPINKKIWTGSYVLLSTGIALLFVVVLVYLLDFKKYTYFLVRWFEAFGKNPLFIFVLSGLIPGALNLIIVKDSDGYFPLLDYLYKKIFSSLSSQLELNSLLFSIVFIFFYGIIVIWLDKRKLYIKV